MTSLALNLLIALIWLLLSRDPSLVIFGIGFILGFVLLAFFRPVLGSDKYVRRWIAFFRFLLVFIAAFVAANAKVAWTVLFSPRESLRPGFLTYDVNGLTSLEILLLSYCISLTPGTTTVDIANDFRTVTLHALNADDPEAIRAELDRVLKSNILSFTR